MGWDTESSRRLLHGQPEAAASERLIAQRGGAFLLCTLRKRTPRGPNRPYILQVLKTFIGAKNLSFYRLVRKFEHTPVRTSVEQSLNLIFLAVSVYVRLQEDGAPSLRAGDWT